MEEFETRAHLRKMANQAQMAAERSLKESESDDRSKFFYHSKGYSFWLSIADNFVRQGGLKGVYHARSRVIRFY